MVTSIRFLEIVNTSKLVFISTKLRWDVEYLEHAGTPIESLGDDLQSAVLDEPGSSVADLVDVDEFLNLVALQPCDEHLEFGIVLECGWERDLMRVVRTLELVLGGGARSGHALLNVRRTRCNQPFATQNNADSIIPSEYVR